MLGASDITRVPKGKRISDIAHVSSPEDEKKGKGNMKSLQGITQKGKEHKMLKKKKKRKRKESKGKTDQSAYSIRADFFALLM